ncbi:hypothetical protein MTBUT4_550002 [Magnetospirillum sp. UT-4]|nr:hypothetical protein MTBUT4_550002 [Magnetospirillum sp. UT-4]
MRRPNVIALYAATPGKFNRLHSGPAPPKLS